MTGAEFAVPESRVTERRRRIPVIWIIPLLAIAIGIYLAWDTYSKEGPTLTLSFKAAEGLKTGESALKFKGITIGTVQRLDFSPDHSRVLVRVATTSAIRNLLSDDSVFWVVKPELFAGSLRGIGTLLSGPYIEMRPGTSARHGRTHFVGLEDPPVMEADVPGTTYLVRAAKLASISLGSPVFYRDLSVGQVLGWDLGDMADSATLHVFVRKPFDQYVNSSTRFWAASGIKVDMSGAGLSIEVESLKAILLGGIAFETLDQSAPPAAARRTMFPLYADREAADAASFRRSIRCVAYFSGSVRGVAPGSEVTLHGFKVGHVTSVAVTYDPDKQDFIAPVEFEVQPERIIGVGKRAYATPEQGMQVLLDRGLRASLQSTSLITGQMSLVLALVKDVPVEKMVQRNGRFVIPAVNEGGLSGIESGATALLTKVNTIPFDKIGQDVAAIVRNFDTLTSGPQLERSLSALTATLASARDVMGGLKSSSGPAFKRLPQIALDLEGTLDNTNRLMLGLNTGYGDRAKFARDLSRLMTELTDAVRSIRALADLLASHPDALIRGRTAAGAE